MDLRIFGIDRFQDAFLSTCYTAREPALFEQSIDDAGAIDEKKQNLSVAQNSKR